MNPKSKSLDFTALDKLRKQSLYIKPLIALIGLNVVLAAALFTLLATAELYVVFMVCVIALLVFFIVLSVVINHTRDNQHDLVISEFAAANQFQYGLYDEFTDLAGSLFQYGEDKSRRQILSGVLDNLPFVAFAYHYKEDENKSYEHDYMVMEVTLPRVVPHFVIDSEIEKVLPIKFEQSQKIELEGDFQKYFNLYAPDTYSVSALTILAPDAMEALMQHAALCDIEIIQNKLYFYWAKPAKAKEEYEQLFTTVQAVLGRIGDKLTSQDIYATPAQAAKHSHIAYEGVRLKGLSPQIIAYPLALLIFFLISFFENKFNQFLYIVYLLLLLLAVGGLFYELHSSWKPLRLKRSYFKQYGRRN